MRILLPFTLLFLSLGRLVAQTDTIAPSWEIHANKIVEYRKKLKSAFAAQDKEAGKIWLDSLRQYDDNLFAATLWDERWMLEYWLGEYPRVLAEITGYSPINRTIESEKFSPPNDSLFEMLDPWLYDHRSEIYADIENSLSASDREFAVLHLDYLLRIGKEGEAKTLQERKLEAYVKLYPHTPYKRFINDYMYQAEGASKYALGLELGLIQGNWTDDLERYFNPVVGLHAGISYWRARCNVLWSFDYNQLKIAKDLPTKTGTWPKNDHAVFFATHLELGYDIFNKRRLRIFPSAGIGFCTLHPPSPDNTEDPLPDYYDGFYFKTPSYSLALTTDLKYSSDSNPAALAPYNYHGIRVQVGYRWMQYNNKHETTLNGNMFFFAVSFNLFGRQLTRLTL